MNAFFASAADQVITWKKEAQEIDLYSDEALKFNGLDCTTCGCTTPLDARAVNNKCHVKQTQTGPPWPDSFPWERIISVAELETIAKKTYDVEGNRHRRIETGRG